METLDKIKEAESKAARLLEEASEEKAKIIAEGRKKAIDILEQAEAQATKEREQMLEKLRKEIAVRKKERLKAAEDSIRKAGADSKERASKEVSYLYKKFLEEIK